jgi:hypothetical protein
MSKTTAFVGLSQSLLGAGVASVAGALAVRWGFHPLLVSASLGAVGGLTAWQTNKDGRRNLATGAASAAGSQLVLQLLNPMATPKVAVTQSAPAQPAPKQIVHAPGRDQGALPPGVLDAAFERARADLAVAGDGYPHGYEHQLPHGHVMP